MPAPTNSVTVSAASTSRASSATCSSDGRTTPVGGDRCEEPVSFGASSALTSPGRTSTDTSDSASAVCIAIRCIRGICSGREISSQYAEHSVNSRSGWVSWK